MTYTQARMIIWNPDAYDKMKVREAAIFILGTLKARIEDIAVAAALL